MILEFLKDNYIWILVVALLTIFTVIGFLVDKQKSNKKYAEPNNPSPNVPPVPNMNIGAQPVINNQPMMNGPVLNQVPFNNNPVPINNNGPVMGPVQQGTVVNNVPQMSEPYSNPTQTPVLMPNEVNNPQVIENVQPAPITEPMYQPLSEQVPSFPSGMNNNNMNQNQSNGAFFGNNNNNDIPINNMNMGVGPVIPVQPVNTQFENNTPYSMNNNVGPNNMNQGFQFNQPQVIPNNMNNNPIPSPMPNNMMNNTVPTPVNNNNQYPGMNGMQGQGFVYNPNNNNQ